MCHRYSNPRRDVSRGVRRMLSDAVLSAGVAAAGTTRLLVMHAVSCMNVVLLVIGAYALLCYALLSVAIDFVDQMCM
jgi:hypothetical protein